MIAANEMVLRVETSFDYNANTLLNELPLGLWLGRFLDRDLRGRSRDALRSRNSIGYLIDARITYFGPGQSRWRSIISLAHHEHMGLRFTADLFNLTFFGNALYEGRRADLGPSAYMRMRYQTLGFGVQDTRRNNMARLDLVIGQSLSAADIRWADLYTGIDGRVLRSNIRGTYMMSDTASEKTGTMNGFGLAFSGRWSVPIARNPHGIALELEAQDLGFSGWGSKSQRMERDTTITFEGITVDNILELDEVIIGEDALLDTLGLRYRTTAFTTWLPFRLSALARAPLGEAWTCSISIDQRNLPGYLPQLVLRGERAFGEATDIGLALGMGGFGRLRLGASVTHVVRKRVLLALSSPHLPGFFMARARGAGVSFSASFAL